MSSEFEGVAIVVLVFPVLVSAVGWNPGEPDIMENII